MSHITSTSPVSQVFLLTHTADAILCYLQPSDIRALRLVSRLFLEACSSTPTRWFFKEIVYRPSMDGELWGLSTTAHHVSSFETVQYYSESRKHNLDMVDRAIMEYPNLSGLTYKNIDANRYEDKDKATKEDDTHSQQKRIGGHVVAMGSRLRRLRLSSAGYGKTWEWTNLVEHILSAALASSDASPLSNLRYLSLVHQSNNHTSLEWTTLVRLLKMTPLLQELVLSRVLILSRPLFDLGQEFEKENEVEDKDILCKSLRRLTWYGGDSHEMLLRIITASPNLKHLKYTFDGKPGEAERLVLEPALALCSLGLWISDHNLFEDLIHRERCGRITSLTLDSAGVTVLYNTLKDISPYHSSSHTTAQQNLDSNDNNLEGNNDKWACDYMDEEYIRVKLPFASTLKYLNLGETTDPVKSQVKFVNRLLKAFHCLGELVLTFRLYHPSILFEGLGSESCGVERPILHTMSINVGVTVKIWELEALLRSQFRLLKDLQIDCNQEYCSGVYCECMYLGSNGMHKFPTVYMGFVPA